MIEINGQKGGGQILRTALTLSAIKQEPFTVENIRGSRTTPGIQRQHLEAVKAVKKLADADTEGMELGSERLVFKPEKLENQNFTVNIGTAGSVNLVLDTILPITSQFEKSFRIDLKGGTDVKWAPPANTYKHVKMPMLERLGVKASYFLEQTGFYPSGNGRIRVQTEPHSLEKTRFTKRGELEGFEIYSKASKNLEKQRVAERKADEAERLLKNSYISRKVEKNTEYVDTKSTGSIITLKAVYENTVAGFDRLGEKGVRAEKIADKLVKQFKGFHSTEAGVDSETQEMVIEVEEEQPETSGSGGSAGGFGGGLSDDEESFEEEEEELKVTEKESSLTIENIALNQSKSEEIEPGDDFPLRKITLRTDSEVEGGSVSIEENEVENNEEIIFHRGWNVETEDSLKGNKEFRISEQWMEEENIEPEQVTMLKYSENGWTSIETEYLENDRDNFYFEAETDSFSTFASGVESPNVQAGNLETGRCDTFREHEIPEDYSEYDSCQGFEEKVQLIEVIEEVNSETSSSQADETLEEAENRLKEGNTDQASRLVDQAEQEERNVRVKSILSYLFAGLIVLLSIAWLVYKLHGGKERELENNLEKLRQDLMDSGHEEGYSQEVYRKVQEANNLVQKERFDAAEKKIEYVHEMMDEDSSKDMFA